MKLSVVVPTKNRPRDLRNFLESLWNQVRLPDQLIIVDQSTYENTIIDEVNEKTKELGIKLNYIYDQSIKGLVQAKAASIQYNQCDNISFFDDDIVLEKDYLKEIERTFENNPNIMGANGLILNAPLESFFKRVIFQATHFGIFKDNRREVFYNSINETDNKLLPKKLNALSGGLTSFNKEIFDKVPFDDKNRFHAYEDKEHSIRLNLHYPNSMYLIPCARLYHFHASSNRESDIMKTKTDNIEIIKMYKKYKEYSLFGIDLLFLLLGLLLNSIGKSIRYQQFNYITSYMKGIEEGFSFKMQ